MSRRKQLNPKSIKGGGQEPVATVPANTSNFSDEEDFDDGYRPLVISAEDDLQKSQISLNKSDEKSLHSDESQTNSITNNQSVLNSSEGKSLQQDLISESLQLSENIETSSSGHNSELTGYSSQSESLNAMTLGRMDYASDDSQDYHSSKRLVISPAIYKGNTPIPKPRQPTPSKTRRKSDKIVPVVTPEGQKFICPVCKISMTSNNELTAHIRSHNTTSAVNTCTICGKVLSSQSSLDRHMLVHSGERPFRCKICDMSFTTNGNMHRHSRIHEKEGSSHSNTSSNVHKENRDSKKSRRPRPSNLISYTMHNPSGGVKRKHSSDDDNTSDFLLSMETQENSYLMDRENAEQNATSPDKATSFQSDTTDSDTLTCPVCMQTFLCKYGLDTHFESHGNEPATCQICQLGLPSSRLVYLHYFIMHINRKKLSEFASQYKKQSNGMAPLASGFHDLAFTDFSTEKFAHIAKVWCEKNQRRSNSIHHNFHCRKCDHGFPSADVLRMHLEMHPDVCDVTCQTCDVTFAGKQEFEDHVIQHSSEKVIEIFSKKVGTDDNDIQDMLSQPEFLLCLGLKSTKSTSDWCNNNAIERAADKYESQIVAPVQAKPVNHVAPIVIEPQEDLASFPHLPRPSHTIQHRPAHPAFPPRLHPKYMAKHATAAPVEISSSSDGEGEGDMENSDTVKKFQCVICEFAFSTQQMCEKHCRSEHHLSTAELRSAIKINPYSGLQRINPALSFMPYLCKKCTNGFSTKENCVRHIHKQHGVSSESVLQFIATNKRLQDGTLQPSYLAGVEDARRFLAKSTNKIREPKVGSAHSAFRPPAQFIPTPMHSGTSGTYITSPPIQPISVKQEPGDNDQPLDFSMKKELTPCDFSMKIPVPNIPQESSTSDDMPMDLSIKPSKDSSTTSRVATNNVISTSQSMLSSMSSSHLNDVNLQCHIASQHSPAQRPMYRCKHCPATYSTKANIEKHILNVHPQIHAPLFVSTPKDHHHQNLPKSAQSSPALSQCDATKSPNISYNSDSDLSSVTKMLDCASSSKFQAFFPGNDVSDLKLPSSKYLQPSMAPASSPNPLVALEQVFGKRTDESLTDASTNCSRESNTTSPYDEPPAKKKRNSYSDSPHKLQCPYCPRAFPWISSLKRHILTHTGQKPFKCPECPVTFSTKSNRERHMVRKHGLDIQDPVIRAAMEKPYKCHNCDETFDSAGHTKEHYKEAHGGTNIPDYIIQQAKFELLSNTCNQEKLIDGQVEAMSVVSDVSDMTSSLMDFDEEDEEMDAERMKKAAASATAAATPSPTPISAASSPAPTVHPESLAFGDEAPEYLTKINPERDNYNVDRITGCWKCGMKFDSRKILLRHLKDHNIDHSYKCYLCDASFETRLSCLQHTETVHRHDWVLLRDKNKCYNLAEYSNNVEAQVLETLASLGLNADGEEIEGSAKPEVTDEKANADSDYAQRKVFCSFCVKRFWSLQDLRRHMRSHTGERPFECNVCQKRFTLKHSMMRHRRKHTPAEIAQAAERPQSPVYSDDEPVHLEQNMEEDNSAVCDVERNHNDVMLPKPVAPMAPSATLSELFGKSDLLHNLLGVDSTQIDQMLQTKATDAAKLLGVGDK